MTPADTLPAPIPQPIAVLDADGAGNWQGAVRDKATGEWFLAEALPVADREDTIIHRFAPDGTPLDRMLLRAGDGHGIHLTSFGVHAGTLWVTWNEQVNDVVTVPYRAGETIRKDDTKPMHVFSTGNIQISLSPTRDWAALRRIQKDTETYRRVAVTDILGGRNRGRGVPVVIPRHPDRVVQGFALVNDRLYVYTGESNQIAWREHWSFSSGKLIGKQSLSQYGLQPGETGKHETEGADGRTFGFKVFQGDQRVLRVYEDKDL